MTWLPVFSQLEALKTGPWGAKVARILSAALDAVEPGTAVRRSMQRQADQLLVDGQEYDLHRYRRVWIVGAGKAGAPMAESAAGILGERLSGGLVIVKEGHAGLSPAVFDYTQTAYSPGSLSTIEASQEPGIQSGGGSALPDCLRLIEAGHPIPDERGMAGAQQIASLLEELSGEDLVICLISGGGSALLVSPAPGLSLADLQALTASLLACGASINEINTLRKHLEQLKGGGLARLAHPASLITLILSDVVGDPLDVIASGPTVPDLSTFGAAWEIIERYQLASQLPAALIERLRRGCRGELPETPKPGDQVFKKVQNVVIGSNLGAAQAALDQAQREGFHSLLLTTRLQGEARQAGRFLAAIARQIAADGRPLSRPACLVAGGETTVTLRGHGKGGRNQEMALAAALKIRDLRRTLIVCAATDGSDGPTDAAGAMVDGDTLRRAQVAGLDPLACLADNNSYEFFDRLGDLIRTGPTNTNVNDLIFVFAW